MSRNKFVPAKPQQVSLQTLRWQYAMFQIMNVAARRGREKRKGKVSQ